jgi:hypothetical protein
MDTNATRTCGSRFVLNAFRNGNDITVIETDTAASQHHARCYCHFDMYISIAPLPAGKYNVAIKGAGFDFHGDTGLVKTTSFVINDKKFVNDSIRIISSHSTTCGGIIYSSPSIIKKENIYLSAFPNPLSYQSTISFSLERRSNVSLQLFDLSGRLVNSILNNEMNMGRHDINLNSDNLNHGLYILKLKTPYKCQVIKLSII